MGWGSSTRRGGGRKVRALPRQFVFLGFRKEESGMSREFCRDVLDPWGCAKSLCKKSSGAFFIPQSEHELLHYPHSLRPMVSEHSPASKRATRLIYHVGEEVREWLQEDLSNKRYLGRAHTTHSGAHFSFPMIGRMVHLCDRTCWV